MIFSRWALLVCLGAAGCGDRNDAPVGDVRRPSRGDAPAFAAKSLAGYDVVVIAVDSLRADRVNDDTAPYLAALGKEGLTFDNAAASSSHVLQSLASFFSGRLPTAGGTIGAYEAEPHDPTKTLAQYFERAGYYTGMLANQPMIEGAGFTKGFAEIDIAREGQPLDDARLVERAAEFFEDAADDPTFLYVHFAGPRASRLYQDAPGEESVRPLKVAEFAENYAGEFPPTEPVRAATLAEYDDAILAADQSVQALIDVIHAAGRAERTLYVVTSMTGFELLEHGFLGTGWTVYDEAIRVPLILYAVDAFPATRISDAIGLVDVMPTLLALVGLELDNAPVEGASLFAVSSDAMRYLHRETPRVAEVVIPERCIVRSVTKDGLKYVAASLWTVPAARFSAEHAHKDTANAFLDGSRALPPLWGAGAYEALFDLTADSGEMRNILGTQPVRSAELKAALEAYRARCADEGIAPRLATQFQSAPDAEQLQNLESLGYL